MTVPAKDGRNATQPYRVRAAGAWYWVDPTVPRAAIEAGDTVVIYPVGGDAVIAVVQHHQNAATLAFADLDGARFEVAAGDVSAIHLAAVDDQQ